PLCLVPALASAPPPRPTRSPYTTLFRSTPPRRSRQPIHRSRCSSRSRHHYCPKDPSPGSLQLATIDRLRPVGNRPDRPYHIHRCLRRCFHPPRGDRKSVV